MANEKTSTANAEHFIWGDQCDGWFLAKHPLASVIQERMLPHTSETRHYHQDVWQFFYILSGELTLELGMVDILDMMDMVDILNEMAYLFVHYVQ